MPRPKPNKKARITQACVNRGMRHRYSHLHSQYGGYHSTRVLKVRPRDFEDAERPSQFLTHLSTALKTWYCSLPGQSEIEIQIALVDDTYYLISSNKNETASTLYNELVAKCALNTTLTSIASSAIQTAKKSKAVASSRSERHASKLKLELTGERDMLTPAILELEQKGRDIVVAFDVNDDIGADMARFLSGGTAKRVAIIQHTGMEAHAEQKILIGLCKAATGLRRDVSVVFSGTFRPCRGCYESLMLVQKYYLGNLQFGARPGHFWTTTSRAHSEIFKLLVDGGCITPNDRHTDFDGNGRLRGLTHTSHRPSLRTPSGDQDELHYGTDSDSEAEDD